MTDGDTGSHVCSSSCCKAAALGITRKVQRARMRESVTILFISSKRKLTPFRREHSIRSQDGVRKMGRKTSELTKTFSRTSTSEEHDESLEGRLGVEEKLRYPSTSYVKVVLDLGHNFKEEGEYQATEGGVQGVLGALMTHFLLGDIPVLFPSWCVCSS